MSTRSALSLLLLAALYASLVLAQQDTSIVYPTTAAATATPLPSAHGYTYAGCYNETTRIKNAGGVRALPDMSVRKTAALAHFNETKGKDGKLTQSTQSPPTTP